MKQLIKTAAAKFTAVLSVSPASEAWTESEEPQHFYAVE